MNFVFDRFTRWSYNVHWVFGWIRFLQSFIQPQPRSRNCFLCALFFFLETYHMVKV